MEGREKFVLSFHVLLSRTEIYSLIHFYSGLNDIHAIRKESYDKEGKDDHNRPFTHIKGVLFKMLLACLTSGKMSPSIFFSFGSGTFS